MSDDLTRVQFWLVWHEDGGVPTYRHHCKKTALDEAERLAKSAPGEVFFVLKATAGVRARDPFIERVRLKPDDLPF